MHVNDMMLYIICEVFPEVLMPTETQSLWCPHKQTRTNLYWSSMLLVAYHVSNLIVKLYINLLVHAFLYPCPTCVKLTWSKWLSCQHTSNCPWQNVLLYFDCTVLQETESFFVILWRFNILKDIFVHLLSADDSVITVHIRLIPVWFTSMSVLVINLSLLPKNWKLLNCLHGLSTRPFLLTYLVFVFNFFLCHALD